jgi:hypothetical protein
MSTHGGTSTSAPPATTVTGPDTIGAPAVVGTGLHYARNDHDHGLPILDYNAYQYNDLLGWTYDPASANTWSSVAGPAYILVCRIPLPKSLTVTNILVTLAAVGLTLTNSFLGLWNSTGTVLGQTADQSTAWGAGGSTGVKSLALVGGPVVCPPLAANDFLWAGIYIGTKATMPQMESAAVGGSPNAGTTAARARFANIPLANTPTLTSFTPGNLSPSTSGLCYWMAIS